MNRSLLFAVALTFAITVPERPLFAIPEGRVVQRDAEEILSRPEFSRVRKLNRSDLVREDLSRRGPGNGNGAGPGQGNGDGAGNRGQQGNAGGNGDNQGGNGNNPGEWRNRRDQQEDLRRNNQNFPADRNPRNAGNRTQNNRDSSFRPSASFGDFGAGMAGIFKVLGMLALAAMLALIVIMIVKAIQDRESRLERELTGNFQNDLGELEVDHPPSEYSSTEYLRRAEEYARQGAFREAVAFVLLGAMSEVESRGLIRYRKGLTQRDYYRTVRRHETLGPAYRSLLKIYEPLGFGRRIAELQHYQSAIKSFQGGFRDRVAISEV